MRKEFRAVVAAVVLASSVFGASYNCDRFEASDASGMQQSYVDVCGDYAFWQEDTGMGWQRLCAYDVVNQQSLTISEGVDGTAGAAYAMSGGHVVWRQWCNGGMSQCLYGYDLAAREEFTIRENIAYLERIAADANLAVWKQDCNEGMQYGLYGCDLEAREEFVISEPFNADMWMGVRVNGEYVMWQAECEDGNGVPLPGTSCLYGYDSVTRERFVMDSAFSDMDMSMIDADGGIAVWVDDCNGGMDRCIVGYDMNARAPFLIEERVGDIDWESRLNIAGGYVVWREYDSAQGINQVKGYDIAAGEHFLISGSGGAITYGLAMNGRYVVIREDSQLWGYCLLSRELFVMREPEMNVDCRELEISDEDLAVWIEDSWSMPERHDIVGYDLAYRQEFAVDVNEGQIMPDMENYGFEISGNNLVWREEQYENYMNWYVVAGASIHRVDNDECSDAVEVFDDQLVAGSTAWARGEDESSCGFGDSGDVWHYYRPADGGQVTIRTDGSSFDTVLSVFNACGGDELACNDDYSIYHTDSKVELQVVKGKTYYIRVAGFNGASGDYQLLATRGVCGTPIRSDLNEDCKVDMKDFAIFAADWLASDIQY